MGTAAEGKNRFRPGTGILVCLFLLLVLPGFAGAEGRIVEYRLPVQMEEQETAGDGETVFVGKRRKRASMRSSCWIRPAGASGAAEPRSFPGFWRKRKEPSSAPSGG